MATMPLAFLASLAGPSAPLSTLRMMPMPANLLPPPDLAWRWRLSNELAT